MEILVLFALVVLVVLILGYPIVNPGRFREQLVTPVGSAGSGQDLYGARESVFEALRDLQFEHATGKLSNADYEQLKARYEVQAAEILQKIDALKPVSAAPGTHTCPRCHFKNGARDKFCTRCGAKL